MVIKNQTDCVLVLHVKWKGQDEVRQSTLLPQGDFIIGDGDKLSKIVIQEVKRCE